MIDNTARCRSLSIAQVCRMSDEEAEATFLQIRWPESGGKPICPHCYCPICHDTRRTAGAPRFRCKACRKDFSITSGTLFASHKLPLRSYLVAIAIFVNEVKGKNALALSRDLGVQYKTAFVLAHAQESAWREDHRRVANGDQVQKVIRLAMKNKPSVDFCGYWQRSKSQ